MELELFPSKTRLFVSESILINLCYTLIYPFLNYGITAWGNTYPSITQPLLLPQKRALRLITFSGYREHTNPLFIKFEILKFHDLVKYNNALFVFNFHSGKLPEVFNNFFTPVNLQHNYRTRLASKSSFRILIYFLLFHSMYSSHPKFILRSFPLL